MLYMISYLNFLIDNISGQICQFLDRNILKKKTVYRVVTCEGEKESTQRQDLRICVCMEGTRNAILVWGCGSYIVYMSDA